MFTGIIEELGTIEKFERSREPSLITIRAEKASRGLKAGDSISVDGACLTVVRVNAGLFSAEAVNETIGRTTLGLRKPGDRVNIEGALIAGSKVSGHFVTGHVDGTGRIGSISEAKGQITVEIKAGREILGGIVAKGSVAVDGISLTVGDVKPGSFSVYIIPHTARMTTIGIKNAGDLVNLETDMLGKYVGRHSDRDGKDGPSRITPEFLKEKGFI